MKSRTLIAAGAFAALAGSALWAGCNMSGASISGGAAVGLESIAPEAVPGSGPGGNGGGEGNLGGGRPGARGNVVVIAKAPEAPPIADPAGTFECKPAAKAPSAGSCLTVVTGPDAGATGIKCNPVSNEGCAEGFACDGDYDDDGKLAGFACYQGNANGDMATCKSCDDDGAHCRPGNTCLGYDGKSFACARYCCSDDDCGGGRCAMLSARLEPLFAPVAPLLGVCLAQ